MNDLGIRVLELYGALHDHFGYEPHWWPIFSNTPVFEVIVGAVLVQQTRWESVEAAIQRLMARGWLDPEAMAAADTIELGLLIRPCAFHTQKAPGLQAICCYLLQHYHGEPQLLLEKERLVLRNELLALPRIGRETADTIMLYGGRHPAFIVDAYARRLFSRLDLAPGFDFMRAPYDEVQALIEGALTDNQQLAATELSVISVRWPHLDGTLRHFMWDFHALITEECIHHCLASKLRQDQPGARRTFVDPRKCALHCLDCHGCPLRAMCATYIARTTLDA